MKKENKLDVSKYKKITEKKVINSCGNYFIIENDFNQYNIIDKNGNELLYFSLGKPEFITDDLIIVGDNSGYKKYAKNLKYNIELNNINATVLNDFILDDNYTCTLYDYNLGKVSSVNSFYFSTNYTKFEINNYLDKSNIKFIGNSLNYIDNNRFLLRKSGRNNIIDSKKNILCKLKKEMIRIDSSGILFRVSKNRTSYIGFVNCDNEIINIDIDKYEVVNKNTIIIKKDDIFRIIDEKGIYKNNISYEYIKYDKENNIIVYKKDSKYGIMDLNLNIIIPNEYKDIRVIGQNVFEVPDDNLNMYLINKYNCRIYSHKSSNINCVNKENLLAIYSENNVLIMDILGNIIVPSVSNNIILMDYNKILVDNCIIDLNSEYIDLKINYNLEIECCGILINKIFKSEDDRELFINRVNDINERYLKEINDLDVLFDNNKIYGKCKK